MAITEKQLQQTIVAYFREQFSQYIIVSSLNGIKLTGTGKYSTILEETRSGMLKGWPDLEIVLPDIVLYVELKTPTGVQSQAQKDVQAKLESLNKKYYIVRTFQQFKELINKHIEE